MHILIANPPWDTPSGFGIRSGSRWPHLDANPTPTFPIYLAYASSLAKTTKARVTTIDAIADRIHTDAFVEQVVKAAPDRLVLEVSTPTLHTDMQIIAAIAKQCPDVEVFICGSHATVFCETIMKENTAVTGVIRGEYETQIHRLAEATALSEIRGLSYRDENRIVHNPDGELVTQLDALPFPDRSSFTMSLYDRTLLPSPSAVLITSRGCPFRCTYCVWPNSMYGHTQRRRSAQNVCDEIEWLVAEFGIKAFRFDDDTFALNLGHVKQICNELIARGLHQKLCWDCFGTLSQDDEDMYRLMRKAGCVRIEFGVESGSEAILASVQKSIDFEKAKRIIRICQRQGIETYGTYMIGFPGETEADVFKTIERALWLDTDYIQISYVTPYPGSKLFDDLVSKNILALDRLDWRDFGSTVLEIGCLVPPSRLATLNRIFWRRYFLRPKYVKVFLSRFFQLPGGPKKAILSLIAFINRTMPKRRKYQ